MTPTKKAVMDSEEVISRVLRVGVNTSLLLVSCGTAVSFLAKPSAYQGGPFEVARLTGAGGAFPRRASWLFSGLLRGNGQAIIVAGLVVLVATPLVRVGVSMVAFARQRDRIYTAITAAVFVLLLLSFALGKAG